MDDKKKTQSEIVKRKVIGQDKKEDNEDPFGDGSDFNFKKSKSDKKMNKEGQMEDPFGDFADKPQNDFFKDPKQDNILSGNVKDEEFEFNDNFANFDSKKNKKSANGDFDFEETNFSDQFSKKPKKEKEDFNFDFEDNNKEENIENDPFNNVEIVTEEPVENPIRVEPRPSENLDFGDPFETTEGGEDDEIDPFGKNSEDTRDKGLTGEFDDNMVMNSAGRKKYYYICYVWLILLYKLGLYMVWMCFVWIILCL